MNILSSLALIRQAGGEVFDYVVARGRLQEVEARRIFRGVLSAIDYIHRLGFVHRDIKLENVLIDGNRKVKITDFGFSRAFHANTQLQTSCGSPLYAAPEILFGASYNGPEVDVWSLGVVLYSLLTGDVPFKGNSLPALVQGYRRGVRYRPSDLLSAPVCELLDTMLVIERTNRATLADVLDHPWVLEGHDDAPLFRKEVVAEAIDRNDFDVKVVKDLEAMGFTSGGSMCVCVCVCVCLFVHVWLLCVCTCV